MTIRRALITLAPLLLLSLVNGTGWPLDYNDPPPPVSHRHRHHGGGSVQHTTQGPPANDEPVLRHHNHRHRHAMLATTIAPTTSALPAEFAPPVEHRLRHSNKLYQPFALIESREQDYASNHPRHRPPNTSSDSHPSIGQRRPSPPPPPRKPQSTGVYNLTRAMQRRYFDRDGLYLGVRRMPITTTTTVMPTTTTTTTILPPVVRMRHHSRDKQWRDAKSRSWNGAPKKSAFDWNDDSTWSTDNDDGYKSDEEQADSIDDVDDDLNYLDHDVQSDARWTSPKVVSNGRSPSTRFTKSTAQATSSMAGMLKSNGALSRTGRRLNKPAVVPAPMPELDVMEFEYDDDDDVAGSRKLHGVAGETSDLRGNAYTDEDDVFAKSYVAGQLTEHKLRNFGTEDAVRESRRQFDLNQDRASKHIMRITASLACSVPRPKIIPVQAVNDASKKYKPHCTVLHRCGDDTGCCGDSQRTCVPKSQENVDLYFFVSSGGRPGTIEKLTFSNHTQCHCVRKADEPVHAPPQALRRATVISCTCPKLFETVLQSDGSCRCDCSSGNVGCDWKKRGREHFSVIDRKCINEGRCNLPICEYGHYEKQHGRCPRKEDKFAKSLSFRSGH